MTPTNFPQANVTFGPPQGMSETQVGRLPAYVGVVERGSCKGSPLVVVAWTPTVEEYKDILEGKPIFLTVLGGLPPHMLTTSFGVATNPK